MRSIEEIVHNNHRPGHARSVIRALIERNKAAAQADEEKLIRLLKKEERDVISDK